MDNNEDKKDRFKNRRFLAYGAFIAINVVMGLCFFHYERVTVLTAVLSVFFSGMFAILFSYFGVATWDHHLERKYSNKEDK